MSKTLTASKKEHNQATAFVEVGKAHSGRTASLLGRFNCRRLRTISGCGVKQKGKPGTGEAEWPTET